MYVCMYVYICVYVYVYVQFHRSPSLSCVAVGVGGACKCACVRSWHDGFGSLGEDWGLKGWLYEWVSGEGGGGRKGGREAEE